MGTLGQPKYISPKYRKRTSYQPPKYEKRGVLGLVYEPREYHSPLYEGRTYKSRKYFGIKTRFWKAPQKSEQAKE